MTATTARTPGEASGFKSSLAAVQAETWRTTTGDDSGLVVTGSVACKLENLSNDGGLPLVGSDGLALGTSRSLLCRQDFLLCWQ